MKKIKKTKKVQYFLEYVALLSASALIRTLPRQAALRLSLRLGDLAYYCLPVRRKLVRQNLKMAFPDKDRGQIRQVARGVYRNFAKTVVEHLRLHNMSRETLLQIVRFEGQAGLQAAFDQGRGAVLVGGHIGNWEYMVAAIGAAGFPIKVVAADIKNPWINAFVKRNRQQMGADLLPKKGAGPEIAKTLSQNGGLVLLMDQDARKRGVFVDFFGRPASTPKGPAKLALSYKAPLFFMVPVRNADDSLTVSIRKIPSNDLSGSEAERVKMLTQRCTGFLEEYIARYPDQWFWLHRRWKTRPFQSA